MHDLTWTFDDHEPRYRHEEWRKVFDEQSKSTPLSLIVAGEQYFSLPIAEETEKFEVRLSKEGLWERYRTLSQIAMLEGEEREVSFFSISRGGIRAREKMLTEVQATYRKVMEILSSPDVEIDGDGNVVSHGETIAVWTTKIPEDGRDGLGDTVETP